jgi:hypothetical protein
MAIPEHFQKHIDEFFTAIEPLKGAYQNGSFSYAALRHKEQFVIVQGYLYLSAPSNVPYSHFCSENIRVGHYRLSEMKTSPEVLIEAAFGGRIATPGGDLSFQKPQNGERGALYIPFHQAGLQAQHRLNVLRLSGGDWNDYFRQPFLDWELKAAPTPYDGLGELMAEYHFAPLSPTQPSFIDVVAAQAAAVDFSSQIQAKQANLFVRLAHGLEHKKFTLGYRAIQQGKVIRRSSVHSSDFQWSSTPEFQTGTAQIGVPESTLLHCIAGYDGIAQHFAWVSDHSTILNTRRAAYEVFDDGMAILKEIFGRISWRGHNARDLETAVAWLLWMLGYSVVHLGNTRGMEDAADLLAATPVGHLAVIECTTGMLKAENKLSLLHDRAQAVRRGLDASANGYQRVMTVIVTSQPRADIEVDLEQAEKLGILVLTRENLELMLERTLIPQNADQIYQEAEETIKLGQAKYLEPNSSLNLDP